MNTRVRAYAKLNLSLEVLGRRDDGYHTIRSIVQTIDLADHLTLTSSDRVLVECSEEIEGVNLAEQAARALQTRTACDQGVRIRIEKHIPMGAGLGGGSSDAAAVLQVMNAWAGLTLPASELLAVGAELGSDVPLFLKGGCLLVEGRGDPSDQRPLRPEVFVVLVPPIHCATSDIYRAWRSVPPRPAGTSPELGRNDLFPAAVRIVPELAPYGNAVARLGASFSGMTGSGAAFYAAFDKETDAKDAFAVLAKDHPACRVHICRATESGCHMETREETP